MDDMERYGDYNEIDEPPRGRRSGAGVIIKILIALICFVVVGFIAFRVILFNYYPRQMKNIYYNDALAEHYVATEGNIGAQTQHIRFPYDDAKRGRFFSDYLIVIRELGQLQITLRYNNTLISELEEEYGVDLDETGELFTFRLARDPRENPSDTENTSDVIAEPVGVLTVNESAEYLMYTYHKLVFDGINFGTDGEPTVEWLRVEVYVNGIALDEPIMLLIYENNEAYAIFTDYELSEREVP